MARVRSLINENNNQLKRKKQQILECVSAPLVLTAADSGATVYWTHSASQHGITLPVAEVGMSFKFVIAAGHGAEHTITCNTADEIIGKVNVMSSTANKCASQLGNKSDNFKEINLHATTTTLGGDIGDIIELHCLEANHWTCSAVLTLRTGNPASIAVLTT